MEAEFFHADRQADGQTDLKKLIFAFRNFPSSFKNTDVVALKPVTRLTKVKVVKTITMFRIVTELAESNSR